MTREEALKIIESNRLYYRYYKQEEFDEAVERLKEPITLADFLGWEEGVEYRRGGNVLKVEDNHLLDKRPNGKFYNTNCSTAELIDLRNATKYEPKYYAKIKGYDNPLIRGFTVTGKHRIETTDFYLTTFWILSRDSMSDNFLQFFAYDANLYPTPDFSTWKDNKFKQKQIKKALEFTKDFYGEVWLDDVKIKEKSEMENYKQFSNMKQKATESEINNYQQFEICSFSNRMS